MSALFQQLRASCHDAMINPGPTLNGILENSVVRFTTVIIFLVFIASASWSMSAWFTKIDGRFQQIDARFQQIDEGLGDIEERLDIGTADRWRRSDMTRWCRETELVNPEWNCGELQQ